MSRREIDYQKYRIRCCRWLCQCQLCGQDIKTSEMYHDGGYGRRAHVSCASKLKPVAGREDGASAMNDETMESLLRDANEKLRSAYQIAKRQGRDTNWEAFENQVHESLMRQHVLLYSRKLDL